MSSAKKKKKKEKKKQEHVPESEGKNLLRADEKVEKVEKVELPMDDVNRPGELRVVEFTKSLNLNSAEFFQELIHSQALQQYLEKLPTAKLHAVIVAIGPPPVVCEIENEDTVGTIADGTYKVILRPSTTLRHSSCFLCKANLSFPGHSLDEKKEKSAVAPSDAPAQLQPQPQPAQSQSPQSPSQPSQPSQPPQIQAQSSSGDEGKEDEEAEEKERKAVQSLEHDFAKTEDIFKEVLKKSKLKLDVISKILSAHEAAIAAQKALFQAQIFHLQNRLDTAVQIVEEEDDEEDEQEGEEVEVAEVIPPTEIEEVREQSLGEETEPGEGNDGDEEHEIVDDSEQL